MFWHSTPSSLKTSELTHINRFIFAGLTPAPCSAPLTQVTPDHWARDPPGSWTPVTPPPAPEHLRRVWVTSINHHHQLARYHWSHWSKKCYRIRYITVNQLRHFLNFISDANWYPLSPSPKFIMLIVETNIWDFLAAAVDWCIDKTVLQIVSDIKSFQTQYHQYSNFAGDQLWIVGSATIPRCWEEEFLQHTLDKWSSEIHKCIFVNMSLYSNVYIYHFILIIFFYNIIMMI